jgi:hypothetical protein
LKRLVVAGIAVLVASSLASIAYVALAWFGPGAKALDERAYAAIGPGQSVTMDSGLSFTAPADTAARESGRSVFYRVPSYVPLGEAASGWMRSDFCVVLRYSGDNMIGDGSQVLTALSLYDPKGCPDYTGMHGGKLLARSGDVDVYWLAGSRNSFRLETHLSGRERGFVFLSGETGDPYSSLAAVWSDLHISGAALPPRVAMP